ncbi:NADH:flavin oxidoreductase [Burkholderia stabilis]|nr:NADH:flavin oxidoreductase [Burkholderia stabilis]
MDDQGSKETRGAIPACIERPDDDRSITDVSPPVSPREPMPCIDRAYPTSDYRSEDSMTEQSASPHAPFFRSFPFGRTTLRNRIVMAPMTRNRSPGGIPGQDVADYYRRRAQGGVGLIVTEGTYIDHPAANGYANVPAFFGEAALAGWARVVEAVHDAGACIVPQLWHVGAIRRPGAEPDRSVPGVGPMTVVDNGVTVVEALDDAEIAEIVASYARAAADARRIGFDGVEIHGAHEYLIDQFLWDTTNRRTDAYGGNIANRTRLASEIVRAVKRATSIDFPVMFRFSQWKIRDYDARIAHSPADLEQILLPLVEAGVDIFHVSTRRYLDPAFPGSPDSLAVWTRRLSGKPVVCVGSVALNKAYAIAQLRGAEDPSAELADLDPVENQLRREEVDLVALGRPLLADPDWPSKVRENRLAEIRAFDRDAMLTSV